MTWKRHCRLVQWYLRQLISLYSVFFIFPGKFPRLFSLLSVYICFRWFFHSFHFFPLTHILLFSLSFPLGQLILFGTLNFWLIWGVILLIYQTVNSQAIQLVQIDHYVLVQCCNDVGASICQRDEMLHCRRRIQI